MNLPNKNEISDVDIPKNTKFDNLDDILEEILANDLNNLAKSRLNTQNQVEHQVIIGVEIENGIGSGIGSGISRNEINLGKNLFNLHTNPNKTRQTVSTLNHIKQTGQENGGVLDKNIDKSQLRDLIEEITSDELFINQETTNESGIKNSIKNSFDDEKLSMGEKFETENKRNESNLGQYQEQNDTKNKLTVKKPAQLLVQSFIGKVGNKSYTNYIPNFYPGKIKPKISLNNKTGINSNSSFNNKPEAIKLGSDIENPKKIDQSGDFKLNFGQNKQSNYKIEPQIESKFDAKFILKDDFGNDFTDLTSNFSRTEFVDSLQKNENKNKKLNNRRFGFNSNLIWQIVSVSLILGVGYMFFAGLQPLILRNYLQTGTNQILANTTRFNLQTEAYANLATKITTSQSFDPSQLCTSTEPFDETFELKKDIESLSQNLTQAESNINYQNTGNPQKPKLTWQGFYLPEADSVLTNFEVQNQTAVSEVARVVQKINAVPAFFEHKNQWLSACQEIQKATEINPSITLACQKLVDEVVVITGNQKQVKVGETTGDTDNSWFFWQAINDDIRAGSQLCSQIIEQEKNTNTDKNTAKNPASQNSKISVKPQLSLLEFKQKWLQSYNKVMIYRVVLASQDDQIRALSEQFLGVSKESVAKIEKIGRQKSNQENQFYILSYQK